MMGLTDRVEPWARRFQRTAEREAEPMAQPARASLRAPRDDAAAPPERRTGRFTRRGVPQEQDN